MSLDDAVKLVMYAFENANAGDIMVQKHLLAPLEHWPKQ